MGVGFVYRFFYFIWFGLGWDGWMGGGVLLTHVSMDLNFFVNILL